MEEDENEVNIPEWAYILIIIVILGGLTLLFSEGYSLYIIGTALFLSIVALVLAQIGVLEMDFKITKDDDKEEEGKKEED